MIITLVAALSLAASAAVDVPYLPQTDALCGGAATAMVFRYWGDIHADVQEFAPLVDRRAGGIADDALVAAVEKRGWRAERVDGSLDALQARLRDRQPVVVLVADRGSRYHYVVVISVSTDTVVVHDPSWGPSRPLRAADFERLWRAANFWSLVILPPVSSATASLSHAPPPVLTAVTRGVETACDTRLNRALTDIRERGFEHAETLLDEVRAACPNTAGPIRELSGVRFAERRWDQAAALARDALAIDGGDAYALDVLGSSLFMQDDYAGALRAWNQIERPRVNLVRIEGLHHTRYQTIADALAIRPNVLLTADVFERARRRLGELPDQSTARLAVRPESDGFADVDVVVAERATIPRGVAAWTATAVRAGVDRELTLSVPGFTGQGDVWSASWRWWSRRPAVSMAFATPHVHGLPGVWRVEGRWQSDTYGARAFQASETRAFQADGARAFQASETRAHAALTVSDWLSGSVRYALTTGFDSWKDVTKAVAIGGSIERRALGDRVSVSADASRWLPVAGGPSFHAFGTRATFRSSTANSGWALRATAGAERVSDAAPFGLWPGAGDGHAREPLLRAHPLLDDGVVDVSGSSVFGRGLAYGNAEMQRWFARPALVRLGVAGFVDVARASRQLTPGQPPIQFDLGAGFRVKVPGSPGVLRVDVAHGVRDGANALTFGWLF